MHISLPLPNVSMVSFSDQLTEADLAFDPALYQPELSAMEANGARYREFLLGRHAAHRALCQSGDWQASLCRIGRDEFGAPQWPEGATGSISHSRGTYVAAAASRSDYLSLGIDVEAARGPGLARAINRLCKSEGDANHPNPTVLFSAKEAIYKAVHPHIGGHLWFTDFTVEQFGADGTFFWSFNPNPNVRGAGYFLELEGAVLTCVALPCDHTLSRKRQNLQSMNRAA